MCQYRYTQQPPRYLPCNPYSTGRLITSCEVIFGQTEEPVSLQWVFTPASSNHHRVDNKYALVEKSNSSITSQLNVETLSDADVGFYHCQVRFQNGSLAERSQLLDLFSSQIFEKLSLRPCPEFIPQAVQVEHCAFATTMASSPPCTTREIVPPQVFVFILLLIIGAYFCIVWMLKKCSTSGSTSVPLKTGTESVVV